MVQAEIDGAEPGSYYSCLAYLPIPRSVSFALFKGSVNDSAPAPKAFAPSTMNKINAQIVLWGCYTLSTFSPPSVHLGYACDEAETYYPSRKSKIFTRGPRIYPTENTFGGGLAFLVLRTHTCSPHFVIEGAPSPYTPLKAREYPRGSTP